MYTLTLDGLEEYFDSSGQIIRREIRTCNNFESARYFARWIFVKFLSDVTHMLPPLENKRNVKLSVN